MAFTLQDADPGIRDVLAALWEAGYDTTDSGDGVSKPEFARTIHMPHVVLTTLSTPDVMVTHSARVLAIINTVRPNEIWQVEVTWATSTKQVEEAWSTGNTTSDENVSWMAYQLQGESK